MWLSSSALEVDSIFFELPMYKVRHVMFVGSRVWKKGIVRAMSEPWLWFPHPKPETLSPKV